MTSTTHEQSYGPGVYAAALVALTSHIAEHGLSFNFIDNPNNGQPLEVFVSEVHHGDWLNSVEIVGENNTSPVLTEGRLIPIVKTIWEIRLPDTATRVHLRTWREVPSAHGPATLSVVPA